MDVARCHASVLPHTVLLLIPGNPGLLLRAPTRRGPPSGGAPRRAQTGTGTAHGGAFWAAQPARGQVARRAPLGGAPIILHSLQIEFKFLPLARSTVSGGTDPRTSTSAFLFEQFVPLKYRQQLKLQFDLTESARTIGYYFRAKDFSRSGFLCTE